MTFMTFRNFKTFRTLNKFETWHPSCKLVSLNKFCPGDSKNMDIYAYADDVIREGMASYWKDSKVAGSSSGHFVRRSSHGIKNYVVSKSVDTLVNKEPKLAIMLDS